ncbi:MAG: hypothetical protein K2H38_00905 [Muribaculaceae bacterium]|nr:hypothetical protein [Muribaculaceae bacterium]MDE6553025.1 hypothetical protein [Muribaculaceae bacterium]
MKRYFLVIFLSIGIGAYANAAVLLDSIAEQCGISQRIECENCDTVIDVDGYAVRVTKDSGKLRHLGLDLFTPELKRMSDKGLMDFIETSLFAKSRNTEIGNSALLKISKGKIADFRMLNPDSVCDINHTNANKMSVEWTLDGRRVAVNLPTNYDTAKTGSRSEIEQDFIADVKAGGLERMPFGEIDPEDLEPYGDEMYILPGGSYMNRNINRHIYLKDNEKMCPVWTHERPLESMANLFLYPSEEYADPMVEVTVLKHEYGEKETLTVPLSHLIAAAEDDGCMTFWGIEKFEDEKLTGSLFFYNRMQGYDHVVKLECEPAEVIEGTGSLKARASLFIPTNNVRDLFAPYVKKTEDQKIKYDKK